MISVFIAVHIIRSFQSVSQVILPIMIMRNNIRLQCFTDNKPLIIHFTGILYEFSGNTE